MEGSDIMVYKYGEWTLYCRDVLFWKGRKERNSYKIYFFSKKTPNSGTPCDMPKGYEVTVNKRSGMPLMKKK